ncbi:MarR family winged helix-turn-helix transcriptional regulator [Mycolicibacterium parafortuitum]|uniref:MarR family transcriptional regulator [Achromobacter xylosoxidans A8] n=1 Tax=Mycolicibacterium parafortuitum TaxID=39692 RepID=A0A375YS11_MYCPF|nr:MarR family winged helix-turn-helix transcriptional regulator [Mycolicibacterium parafortuitum]ORB29049.1 MarR family transcriptional regulator [Mycolicibacterium parafortuitum]SRX83860.1 MarR family transcriptional regulator [Achromobacter xylosoxidans A8] [Mycolicibacterium parafortuitum]
MKEAAGGRAGRLADAFGRAGKSVVRAFDDRLGEHGVSTPRAKLLAEVARMQPVRLADLAREVGISQGTASTLVEALVRDGLVARGVDDNDRRAIRLTTTAAGQAQARKWLRDYVVAAGEVFGCLTAEEQRQLTRLLDRITESLDPPAG